MRPIDRGPAPRSYAAYGEAVDDLAERLGRYCSYCERRLATHLAVEHMAPKNEHRNRMIEWSNFLLGCVNCNSVKGNQVVSDEDVLWPDRHNTMLAIEYLPGGFIRTSGELDDGLSRRARGLVDLVGLDRHDAQGWPSPTDRDRRWSQREEVWRAAEYSRSRFERLGESEEAIGLVLEAATGHGFFSVWMAVFRRHASVRRALIEGCPGTANSCFNDEGEAVNRPCADL